MTGKDTLENGACRMMLEVVFPEETASVENAQKVWLAGLGSIDGIVHNAATRATKARSSETQTSVMLFAWRDDDCLYMTDHPEYDTFGCIYNQDPTALESTTSPSSYQKILRKGQLLIMHDGKIYTIMGIEIKYLLQFYYQHHLCQKTQVMFVYTKIPCIVFRVAPGC